MRHFGTGLNGQDCRLRNCHARTGPGTDRDLRIGYIQAILATGSISAAGLVTGIVAARSLGPSGRGVLALVTAVPTLVIRAGNCGIPQALAYVTAKGLMGRSTAVVSALWLSLILGLLETAMITPVVLAMVDSSPSQRAVGLISLCTAIPVFVVQTRYGLYLAEERFGSYYFGQALPVCLYALLAITLWLTNTASWQTLAIANTLAWVLTLCLGLPLLQPLRVCSPPILGQMRYLLRQGVAFHIPELTGLILLRLDSIIMAKLQPSASLGYYAAATALALGQAAAANPIAQLSFRTAASNSNNAEGVPSVFHHIRLCQPIFAALCIVSIASARFLIPIAFGSAFSRAVPISYPLIAATAIWSLNQLLENALRGLGRAWIGSWSNVAGIAVLTGMAVLLVPRFDAVGMAISVLCGQFTSLSVKLGYCHVKLRVPWRLLNGLTPSTISRSGVLLTRAAMEYSVALSKLSGARA